MTRQQLNPILMIIVTVLIVALKNLYFPNLYGENLVYYLVLVAIAAVVSCFEVAKFLYTHREAGRLEEEPSSGRALPSEYARGRVNDLRDAYRLIYPPESRPILEVYQAYFNHPLEQNLVICDLSESGLGFQHDGMLPLSGTLMGRIRFSDGDSLEIAGDVVHHRHDRVGLALHCYIPHERFMKEQRMLITRYKPGRLNLEVMRRSAGSAHAAHPELAGGCPCQRSKT
jgi:hypothetical protein